MSTKTLHRGEAKDRIIDVALNLFYRQGYHATGVQQIIDEAGVSKGTFYTHFKSKDDLGVAYMQKLSREEITELKHSLAQIEGPYEKYIQFNKNMKEWMKSTGYRGCAFCNMSSEITDLKSPIKKEAKFHYEAFRAIINDMVTDLLNSDKRYKGLDKKYIADQYMVIQIGAMTNAEIYQDTWPYDHADRAIRELIGEKV